MILFKLLNSLFVSQLLLLFIFVTAPDGSILLKSCLFSYVGKSRKTALVKWSNYNAQVSAGMGKH